ncbi:hypothetical protein R3I94_020836 [Phoxinus phoxinus]
MEEERDATLHSSDGCIEEEIDLEGETEPEEDLFDQTSETEDNTEFDPDYHSTDGEEEEEEDPPEVEAAYQSKNGNILWTSTTPSEKRGRLPTHRVIKMTPGPTRFACSNAKDIYQHLNCCEMSNLEGKRVFGKAWKSLDWTDLQAYFGLLILAGVYRSHHEALGSLWHGVSGRAIFRATMPLKTFSIMSRIFCFYKKVAESGRKKDDKLAPVRDIREKWVQRLPLLYKSPSPTHTLLCPTVPEKNKNVLLMSTLHRDAAISSKEHKKPEIILHNKTKGGVDNLDKIFATFTCQRKTNCWHMVIFFNMLDVSA